jgi:hypothetical protein
MDSRKTLFLLVLVAIAGGVVLWDHYRGVPTEERLAKSKRVIQLDTKTVTQIELVRSNETIRLEKTGDHWDIKEPLAVRAEFSAVSSLLDELEFADRLRTLSDKDVAAANLAEFGLAAPALTIKLRHKTGSTVVRIGAETPAGDAVYVNVEGQKPVFVVRKFTFNRVHQSLDQLRSRTVMEFSPAATTKLEIKSAERSVELTKSNLWVLTRPLAARADQGKVGELLNDLQNLRVLDFVSEKPADVHTYNLDEPEREITVFAGATGQTLLFGKPLTNDSSKVYAKLKGADSIFTVAATSAKRFAVQVNDLRDPRLLTIAPAEAQTVQLTRGADKISLRRESSGWQVVSPIALPADDEAVRAFLAELNGWRVKQFVADVVTDLEKFGLANPALTLAVDGVPELQVGGMDAASSVRFVKRADEPFIYGIEPAAVEKVPGDYGAFRSRVVFDFAPAQITKLTVGEVTVSRNDSGLWQLVAPAQGVLDVEAVNAVAGVVAALRAERFGRPKTESDGGNLVVKFTAAGVNHWIGNAGNGLFAADNTELTFQLAAPIVETLSKKLVHEPTP